MNQDSVMKIYDNYISKASNRRSKRMGASSIGQDCERKTWLSFRWASPPLVERKLGKDFIHAGQYQMIFETGHYQEERLIRCLRETGFEVSDIDPVTNYQYGYTACNGHFVCYVDGFIKGLIEAPKTNHVLEIKSSNRKYFIPLKKKGIEDKKPVHYIQMQIGMLLSKVDRGYYLVINKDTEELYQERVKLDKAFAQSVIDKAQRLINSQSFPSPSESILCDWCDHVDVCKNGFMAERNCRTCLHSTPIEKGRWSCALVANIRAYVNNKEIKDYKHEIDLCPKEMTCEHHRYLPAFVPGKMKSFDGEFVYYEMGKGGEWVDKGV